MMMNTIAFLIFSLLGYIVWQIVGNTAQMKAVPLRLRINSRRKTND